MGHSHPFIALAASESEEINHFDRNDDLDSTRSTWLQADRAYVCFGIVDIASSETPTVLSDRRMGPIQIYIGKAYSLMGEIIVEVLWDRLCQDISQAYMKENL